MDSFSKKKTSWGKKLLLTSVGLANLATPAQPKNKAQAPNRPNPTSIKSPTTYNSAIPRPLPSNPGAEEESPIDEEPGFNQPIPANQEQNYGKENQNYSQGEQGKSGGNKLQNKVKEKTDEAQEKVKEHAKEEVKKAVVEPVKAAAKQVVQDMAATAMEAVAGATSEVWVPILIIVALIIGIIGISLFLYNSQMPGPGGMSDQQMADSSTPEGNTLLQQLSAASGNAQLTNQDITALLNSAEQEIKQDMSSTKSGSKNYDAVQKLGKQGLDLITKIRSEISSALTPTKPVNTVPNPKKVVTAKDFITHSLSPGLALAQAPTDDSSLIRTQLSSLADIITQLNSLTGINLANCPNKPLLESGIAPAASSAMQCVGVSLKYAHPSQTIGNAPASAGTHLAESGENYSAATDLSIKGLDINQVHDLVVKLDSVGFAAFYRNWSGNRHIHVIYLGVPMKSILQRQVRDYVNGRDGLGSHCTNYTFYQPPESVKQMATQMFQQSNPGFSLTPNKC